MFEVFWSPPARGQPATIGTEASNRNAVTFAVDSIDRSLRNVPREQGESREADYRVFILPPLVVDFRIKEEDRRVEVLAVRTIRRKPS